MTKASKIVGMPLNLVNLHENSTALAGDASSRQYFRVEGASPGVLCLDPQLKSHEHPFLVMTDVLRQCQIPCPEILQVDLDNQLIFQEDLGQKSMLAALGERLEDEKKFFQEALKILWQLQKINTGDFPKAPFVKLSFDEEKYLFELNHTKEFFLEKYLLTSLTPAEQKLLDNFHQDLIDRLLGHPQVFCHRDFHTRNIMVKEDQTLALIDYQDARMGSCFYDLVSLLEDCYFSLRPSLQEELLQSAFETLNKSFNLNRPQFSQFYAEMSIQRIYKAVGSFAMLYVKKNDARYLKYIGGAMENLKRHLHNDLLKDNFKGFSQLLYKAYYSSEKHWTN